MSTLKYNHDASFKYIFLDKFEAGIELYGWEVTALKQGQVDFKGSYIKPIGGQLFWVNAHIAPSGTYTGETNPTRSRRLLLHRQEINKLLHQIAAKSVTVVPVRVYTTRNLIKIEIALARGKKKFEQGLAKKRKAQERQVQRELKKGDY
jgi:SsrA-binding protein